MLTGYWLWVVYFTLIAVLVGLYHTILVVRSLRLAVFLYFPGSFTEAVPIGHCSYR